MKKIIFLISLLISVVTVNAQTQIVTYTGTTCSVKATPSPSLASLASTLGTTSSTQWTCTSVDYSTLDCSLSYQNTNSFPQFQASITTIFTLNIPYSAPNSFTVSYILESDNYKVVTVTVTVNRNITSIENTIVTSSIEVYPNPFIDNVNLKVNALESSISNITLTDITGKVYENKEVELTQGENIINVPVNCPKGLYLLSLIMENKIIKYKIIK
ncbi:MAG: T9SS type A sorting domain-containing protein [Bacteroidia bacterium]|nr:T9SS type A sorting domain-containing protein [Bacteroidia bacterium]